MRWIIERSADLKVGHKLLLGFSLVMLLTLAVALGGWRTASEILGHAGQSLQVADLKQQILQLRLLEKDYQLAPLAGHEVAITEQHARIAADLTDIASDTEQFQQLQRGNDAYLQQFTQLRATQSQAGTAQTGMAIRADEALIQFEMVTQDQFNLIRDQLLDGETGAQNSLDQAEAAARLSHMLLLLRLAEGSSSAVLTTPMPTSGKRGS